VGSSQMTRDASFVGAFTKEYGWTAPRGWHAQRARNTEATGGAGATRARP
jgi:hypothetical protein